MINLLPKSRKHHSLSLTRNWLIINSLTQSFIHFSTIRVVTNPHPAFSLNGSEQRRGFYPELTSSYSPEQIPTYMAPSVVLVNNQQGFISPHSRHYLFQRKISAFRVNIHAGRPAWNSWQTPLGRHQVVQVLALMPLSTPVFAPASPLA